MKAFVLQMTSGPEVKQNLAFVRDSLAQQAQQVKNSLVVLPECFAFFGGGDKGNHQIAEPLMLDASVQGACPVQQALAALAQEFSIYLVAGTFPIATAQSEQDPRSKPMTLVYGPDGKLITQYQKIHLFDVDVADNTGSYRESDAWQPGQKVAYFDTPWGRIGLAICYDLRFPGLFQHLAQLGCRAVVLPSAFTERTGLAHWQVLLRARAIENQIYMLACDQTGVHANQRETHGHSMIVNPWGTVLVDAEKQTGLFGATLDSAEQDKIRVAMPMQLHNKFHALYKD